MPTYYTKKQFDEKIALKEDKSHIVTVINAASTSEQDPSAKAVYDFVDENILTYQEALNILIGE